MVQNDSYQIYYFTLFSGIELSGVGADKKATVIYNTASASNNDLEQFAISEFL